MSYEIIPDAKLSVDALLDSKALYTESEKNALKKTPWTWHLISGDIPEKNQAFYLDAGYFAFSSVIPLDSTLINVLNHKPLNMISLEDLKIKDKIDRLNRLIKFLELPRIDIGSHTVSDTFYDCKRDGFVIADFCEGKINNNEKYLFKPNISPEAITQFGELRQYILGANGVKGLLKGSFKDYILSKKTTTQPSDIDLVIIALFHQNDYYDTIESYTNDANIDGIQITPSLIPFSSQHAYTFFDTAINEKALFLYIDEEIGSDIILNKHPEKIIRAAGLGKLEMLRSLVANREKIEDFCFSNCERKIYSAIREPEQFYKQLQSNNLGHIVSAPSKLSAQFDKHMPTSAIQLLLAEASIELSAMTQKLHQHIESPQHNYASNK